MSKDYEARARALVGTRFRPQGRGVHGLDCIGVIVAAFGIPIESVPRDYRLRGDRCDDLKEGLGRFFRKVSPTQLRPGDVMLLAAGQEQLHLAVRTGDGFVHAHAGIGRVVETPGSPKWPILAVYRKRRKS